MAWGWMYVAFIIGLYVLLIVNRIANDRREAAWKARRAQMYRELRAAGYYDPPKPPPPTPPQKLSSTCQT